MCVHSIYVIASHTSYIYLRNSPARVGDVKQFQMFSLTYIVNGGWWWGVYLREISNTHIYNINERI